MSHPTDAASEPALPIPSPEAARQVVPHSGLDEARRQAMAALDAGVRTIAVIGAAGTGKTLLMGELADLLRARQSTVHLLRTTHDLLTFRLAQGDAPDPSAVVLLDEADRAGDAELASVLGRGRAGAQEGGLRILAGLPPLLRRLEALGRPAVPVTLNPVPREELSGFIATRLDASGYPPDFFTPEAVEELATRSGGVPRLVNVLTAAAAFAASLDHAPQVTAQHVVEATRHAAGSAQVVRPAPDPQVFAERPAPPPRAPGEPPPPNRPHLVDSVARWAGASWLAPGEAHPGLTPPDETPRAEQHADDTLPMSGPVLGGADAQPPGQEEADLLPATIPPPPEPPDGLVRTEADGQHGPESGPAPVPADELVIPPQPAPAVPVAAPDLASDSPLPPAAPLVETPPPPREPPGPAHPERGNVLPAVAEMAAPPASAEPAAAEAPRRHGWAYAAAALLVLVGAGFALDRSRDAPAGSPLARLSPIRAWIEERAGLSTADRPPANPALAGRAPATTAMPPSGSAPPAPTAPDRPLASLPVPAATPAAPSAVPPLAEARPPAAATPAPAPVPPRPLPADVAPADLPAPSATAAPVQDARRSEPPIPPVPLPQAAPAQFPAPQAPAPQAPGTQASGPAAPPAGAPAPTSAAIPPPEDPATAAAPPANPPRVMVHVLSRPTRGSAGEQALAELTARYAGTSLLRSGRGPNIPVVRHFFDADAPTAEAIAALLSARGITARVQDFTGYRPQPRPGTVEVWLP